MDGEEEKNPEQQTTEQLIQAIADLKKSTVSKEDYDKMKDENAQLLKVLIEGGQVAGAEEKTESIADLRKDLFGEDKHLSNLEYCKKALALRKSIISSGGVDPFCPVGYKVTSDEEDSKAAERVAKVLQECIDYAQGDSAIFTNELQRRMIDTAPQRANAQKRIRK